MPFVARNAVGDIVAICNVRQPTFAEEWLSDNDVEMVAAARERARAAKIAAVKQRLAQALLSVPCPLAGNRPIQLDKDSQGNIGDATQQATVVKASAGTVTWPARMVSRGWRLADNYARQRPAELSVAPRVFT